MKIATVRELRNHYSELLRWLESGEEILITRRGIAIARLVPEKTKVKPQVDWTRSAAFQMDRTDMRRLTAKEVANLLDYNRGAY
jgi:prevent-host-death family protein